MPSDCPRTHGMHLSLPKKKKGHPLKNQGLRWGETRPRASFLDSTLKPYFPLAPNLQTSFSGFSR